jgi:CheY-like chemotaxis protein
MDLMMPAMDGFSAIAALRRRDETADTPVIACTGLSDPASRQKVIAAGFDGHVIKPYPHEELLDMLGRLLHGEPERMARSQ